MQETVKKVGPYTLIRKIGRGAFGVVWLAEKKTAITTTHFALKFSRDDDIDVEAFKQEAAIWVQASGHENIVTLIEADIYDDQIVLVSEYIPDGSLASWLSQHNGKAPSLEEACEMIDGVLAGLAHLHERQIIHRDLKPDNILLRGNTPRLADFGVARILRSTSSSTNISGTLSYMAPEVFDGKRNERTDIWAAGVILYQLLAGRLPYPQQEMAEFLGAVMRHDPPPLPDSVPLELKRAVAAALKRDPSQRFSKAKAMRNAIQDASRAIWLNKQEICVKPSEAEPVQPTIAYEAGFSSPSPYSNIANQASEDTLVRHTGTNEVILGAGNGRSSNSGDAVAETIATQPQVTSEGDKRAEKTIKAIDIKPFVGPRKQLKPGNKLGYLIQLGIVLVIVSLVGGWWINKKIGETREQAQAERDLSAVRAAIPPARDKGFKNQVGMEFALIPAGSFQMGSETGKDAEKPVHRVTISKDFYMEKTEVTQAQWKSVMGNNPSYYLWPTHPVERVDWVDTQNFIKKLNDINDGFVYRLPTEAEWEYACRAGTTGDYAGDLNSLGWYKDNSHDDMQEVAKKQPNAFGLYDMHGSVAEWCQDFFSFDYYDQSPAIDPQGPPKTEWHAVRGGAFSYEAAELRSSARAGWDEYTSFVVIGFRIVATRKAQ